MLKASRIHEWVAGFYHSIHVGVHGDSIGSECVAGSVVEVPRSESLSRIFEMLRKHVHQLTDSARLFDAKIPAKIHETHDIKYPRIGRGLCKRGKCTVVGLFRGRIGRVRCGRKSGLLVQLVLA